jgi:hypothetical protein
VTKAHRFNPSSAAEQCDDHVLGIGRHNCHVVGQRNVGLGGRVVKNQTRQRTDSKVTFIMDLLVLRFHRRVTDHMQVQRRGILME